MQVTSTGVLRINGERQVIENTWHRFGKEFPIPPHCDTNEVSAKFELGVLSVKFPKLITPAPTKPQQQQQQQQHSAEPEAPTPAQAQVVDNKEPISDEKEKNRTKEDEQVDQHEKKVSETTTKVESETPYKPQAKMTQRLKTRILDFNISMRSGNDDDEKGVNKLGFCGTTGGGSTRLKRGKKLMNMVVAILLVLVLGVYFKNALWSSPSPSSSKFQEF